MLPNAASALTGDIVCAKYFTLSSSCKNETLGGVESETLDCVLVEGLLVCAIPNSLDAFILQRRPHSNSSVRTTTDNLLAAVALSELCHDDLILVADEISHHFSILGINHPHHVVLTASQQ